MNGNQETQLTSLLRRFSIWIGLAILIISIYLSYDGFDGSVSGSNQYSTTAKVIGFVFAVAVCALQFIFSTDYRGLNKTLRFVGLFSYVYSIYTNKLGAVNLLGMAEEMAWATAIFADIVAEPLIAWGLGEAVVGDFIGNLSKSMFGTSQRNGETNGEAHRETPRETPNRFYNIDSKTMADIPRKNA